MKHLKIYEEFVSPNTKVNFVKPAFEIKEFWRIFKEFPEVAKQLGFDSELFKEEPELFEDHEYPVFDYKLSPNLETGMYDDDLISKYPELEGIFQKAQSYLYYKNSWDKFDEKIEKGEPIQASSILVINGKYLILGGNRRMAYYIVSKINPMIWVINVK
jgi:hypothetical protein